MVCIYMILNIITNKYYIGSTIDFRSRINEHTLSLIKNCHRNGYLQASWNKHKCDNFKFFILEECSKDILIEREQYWLNETRCYNRDIGYNISKVAGSVLGLKFSNESKANLSKILKGKTKIYLDRTTGKPFAKRPFSVETRAKISEGNRRRKLSAATKEKISNSLKKLKSSLTLEKV